MTHLTNNERAVWWYIKLNPGVNVRAISDAIDPSSYVCVSSIVARLTKNNTLRTTPYKRNRHFFVLDSFECEPAIYKKNKLENETSIRIKSGVVKTITGFRHYCGNQKASSADAAQGRGRSRSGMSSLEYIC